MRGQPENGFPAFFEAEAKLRPRYIVFNPAHADIIRGIDPEDVKPDDPAWANGGYLIREALELDTRWICRHADGIATLDNWRKSKGATAEVALARALGIKVMTVNRWETA
jgi:hypothetical protein